MNRIYYKLGILSGAVSIGIGVLRYILDIAAGRDPWVRGTLIYAGFCLVGFVVILLTVFSRRSVGLRYYSKLSQILLWYIVAVAELSYSGEVITVVIFILGITLAYRYSFLKRRTLLLTAVLNLLLMIGYTVVNGIEFISFIDEFLFVIFVYSIIYIIYTDFTMLLKRRFRRLNRELELARSVTPFGNELNRRLATSANPDIEFTRKEYEVMVAICFYEKLTNEELSDFMNISVATVKSHLNNIYKKTGLHSRSRLIATYKNVFVDGPE